MWIKFAQYGPKEKKKNDELFVRVKTQEWTSDWFMYQTGFIPRMPTLGCALPGSILACC